MIELTPYLAGMLAAYAILLVGSLSPGPSVALLIGIATQHGRKPALVATLGIALGSMTLNLTTLLGVGYVLSQAAWAMSALRFLGAAYLLYLGYGALRKALQPMSINATESPGTSLLSRFIAGYALQITNPKALAFWLAIASVNAVEGAPIIVVLAFLAGGFLISFLCHGAWAYSLSINSIRAAYNARKRWLDAALGGFFVFAAYKLVTNQQ